MLIIHLIPGKALHVKRSNWPRIWKSRNIDFRRVVSRLGVCQNHHVRCHGDSTGISRERPVSVMIRFTPDLSNRLFAEVGVSGCQQRSAARIDSSTTGPFDRDQEKKHITPCSASESHRFFQVIYFELANNLNAKEKLFVVNWVMFKSDIMIFNSVCKCNKGYFNIVGKLL